MSVNPFHIFVVDDDEDDRFIFENALKETDIPATVLQMTNGIELLSFMKSGIQSPSIIFLDLNMPAMGG